MLYEEMGSIDRRPGSGGISKVTSLVKEFVGEQMQRDDETTTNQLYQMLVEKGVTVSLRTILRCWKSLGWKFHGSTYCQLIRETNKVKRLEWCHEHKDDSFNDVVWTDESTVQPETPRRFCCHKKGQVPKPKPR